MQGEPEGGCRQREAERQAGCEQQLDEARLVCLAGWGLAVLRCVGVVRRVSSLCALLSAQHLRSAQHARTCQTGDPRSKRRLSLALAPKPESDDALLITAGRCDWPDGRR